MSAVWIHLPYGNVICYFDTLEEGFEYGHAFLKENSAEINTKPAVKTAYYNYYGEPIFYNYIAHDSLSSISKNSSGSIGLTNQLEVFLYKEKRLPFDLWTRTEHVIISNPGIALGMFNYIFENHHFISGKDHRIKRCTVSDFRHWRDLLILS